MSNDAGREVDAPLSYGRTAPLVAAGGTKSRIRLSSPIASSLIQDRKTGALSKLPLGNVQVTVLAAEDFYNSAAFHPFRLLFPKTVSRRHVQYHEASTACVVPSKMNASLLVLWVLHPVALVRCSQIPDLDIFTTLGWTAGRPATWLTTS